MGSRRARLGLAACACVALVSSSAHAQKPAEPAPNALPSPPPTLTVPTPVSSTHVDYPDGATGAATVMLLLTISPTGDVTDGSVLEGGHPFAGAAVAAARNWHFEPARRGALAIAARIRFEVRFEPKVVEKIVTEVPVPPPPPSNSATTPGKDDGVREVVVRGKRIEASRTVSLDRAEVRQIPGTFGDPFRAVEIMPGVTPIVSGLPYFFVRGAPPGNVGYYLDGIRMPYLFHVGAGPSVVHPGMVDRVDLYPGGYPAQYGRVSGGVVAGETTPATLTPHGEYNIRLFDAGALAEAPIFNDRATLLLGGRYSYTAAVLSQIAPDTTLDYWDFQARATYDVTPRDRLTIFGFGAYDYLGQKDATGNDITVFGTEFYRLDTRYDHRFGEDGTLRQAVTLGMDRTRLDNGRFLRDRMIAARSEVETPIAKHVVLRAGADFQFDRYDIVLDTGQLGPAASSAALSFPSRSDMALGARAELVIDPLPGFRITPGARVDMFASDGASALAFDPRVSSRAKISRRVALLTALGIAHQPPSFVIPVPGFQPGGLKGGLQRAVQESMGVEVDLGQNTLATATVFHNGFFNLSDALSVTQRDISGCAPGTYPTDTLAGDRLLQPTGNGGNCGVQRFTPGTLGSDRSGGGGQGAESASSARNTAAFEARARGSAYGLELLLKRKLTSRIGGFLSYTLSRSTRQLNGQEFIASFDRAQVFNAALAFDLGRNWRAGSRVTFYTGLPKAMDPTDPESSRLRPFFRLDLRIEKRWEMRHHTWISFVAEGLNVTLNKESVGTNCTLNGGCTETLIGPVSIPSIGVEGGF